MSVLTALPKEVRVNVIHFLVPNLLGKGFECPVIATGVASRKHRVWTIEGYHWWKLQAWWADENLLMQVFAVWLSLTAGLLGHA